MATFTRMKLSESTDGKPVLITASSSTGTTIHTAVSGTTSWDEIYMWATNTHTATLTITVEWGATTDPDALLCKTVALPPKSPPIPIVTGQILRNGLLVTAFTSTGSKVTITGYANRIVP